MASATIDTARRALTFVSPEDRSVWIKMGMALCAEFGDDAFDAWDQWSMSSSAYSIASAKASWKSFHKTTKVGIGSLFAEAQAKGFEFGQDEIEVDPIKLAEEREARAKRDAEKAVRAAAAAKAAANRAASQMRTASREGVSPYLERKQVAPESCRFLADGAIIIPMLRYDQSPVRLMGRQQINADGSKKYSNGMDKTGAMCRLGKVPVDGQTIYIGEGYATCATGRLALNYSAPVYVCFDTSGLLSGAKILRALFPHHPFVFLADDDYLTGNSGFNKATEAAQSVGNASVVLPSFTAARRLLKKDESLPMLTDFNDLHCSEGIEVVSQQLAQSPAPSVVVEAALLTDNLSTLPAPLIEGEPASALTLTIPTAEQLLSHFALIYPTTDVWDGLKRQRIKKSAFEAWVGKDLAKQWMSSGKRRTILRESLPSLVGGRAVEGGEGGGKLGEMLDNLTLLRGTETVWDAIGNQVMSLGAVRADYTSELTTKWQEHGKRKTVEARNLVFDPTQQVDPEVYVNMFLGWPLSPKRNDPLLTPIIALLESLCSNEDQHSECVNWILKWLAYPLQHPGAKMQTALLVFGEKQGTGKSLFFQDIIKPIYGEYGVVASQHQLDSSFTAWRSRKLFVLFEEVLSRDDKYSHNGTLKYMISGKEMSVNQKNLPERTEQNHLNSAFLSNEPQPIPIELEDRRFFVIEARTKQSQAFYDAVKASIDAGGIEAFYHYLLHYPLGDFNEHTKPMMTQAKERVIEFGLNGWMAFHRSWKDGYLDAPYCSCLTEDLYNVYKRWCDKSGEKPLTMTKFNGFIASRELKTKKEVSVGPKLATSRMVYVIENPEFTGTLSKQIDEFRREADIRSLGNV